MSTLVSQPSTLITYAARRENLRLTKRRRFPVRNPVTGEVEGQTQGQYVGFRFGLFQCPPSGPFMLVDTLDGGQVEVDAADVIEFLDKHRLNGDQQEGFWRVEQAAPPISGEEMNALTQAALGLDEESLQKILEQERAGWKRPDIISNAEMALERIAAVRAEAEKQAAEAAKPAPKAKPAPRAE